MKASRTLLLTALAAVAAPAFAGEIMEIYTAPASTDYTYVAPAAGYTYVAPVTTDIYVAPVTTNTYVAPVTTGAYVVNDATTYVAPSGTYYVYEAPITVTAPANEDAAITQSVADNIAADPWINGAVGIDTRDNVVTLTGLVSTPGQTWRAAGDARRVDGVDEVRNQIRSRVGDY